MNNIKNILLGELIKIKKGKKPSEISEMIHSDKYLPYLLIESLEGENKLFTNDSSCPVAKKEDTLIVWDGARSGLSSTGHCGYVGSTLAIISKTTEIIDSKYLFYFISSRENQIHYYSEGTGIPHVSRKFIESLKIPLFPIPEQKKIAKIFSEIDNFLKKLEIQIAKLKLLKIGLGKSLLNHGLITSNTNSASFRKVGNFSTQNTEICKNKKISSFAKSVTRKNLDKSSSADVYSVTKYNGFVRSLDYFKKQVFSRDLSTYKIVRKGEFAYSTIHLDEGAIGLLRDEEALISPMYTVFEVDESVDNSYLEYLLRSSELIKKYGVIGQGSVNRRKSVPFSSISNLKVRIPSLKEQKEIAKILSKVDSIIEKKEKKIHSIKSLKKSIMQDIFLMRKKITI